MMSSRMPACLARARPLIPAVSSVNDGWKQRVRERRGSPR
jgi:hypothetical protein